MLSVLISAWLNLLRGIVAPCQHNVHTQQQDSSPIAISSRRLVKGSELLPAECTDLSAARLSSAGGNMLQCGVVTRRPTPGSLGPEPPGSRVGHGDGEGTLLFATG